MIISSKVLEVYAHANSLRTLKHVAQYSPLLSETVKQQIQAIPPQQSNLKQRFSPEQLPLSELPQFISGKYTLDIPVYTVWGACEDVRVLEKFRSGEYSVPNLHIIDEASSRLLDVGGIKLRLLGLGGAVVMHKLFDNGEGRTTIAGGQGTMWTTLLQMGELVDTANRVYDPSETRVFVTHASPARDGLLNQLSVTLKADFSISAGLHFRYGSSYNEFSVNPSLDHYRGKLAASKASFNDVWETVKGEVEPAVDQNDAQRTLLRNALDIVTKMPTVANGGNPFGGSVPGQPGAGQVDESAFKNMWNFNLADAAFGYLVLEIDSGRIGTEMRAQGFNFAHRRIGGKQAPQQAVAPQPMTGNAAPGGGPTAPVQNKASPAQVPSQPSQPPAHAQRQQLPAPAPATAQAQQIPPQQQPKPAQATSSPAPPIAPQAKPATPQPSGGTTVNVPPATADRPAAASTNAMGTTTTERPSATTANGTAATEKPATPGKPSSPAVEKRPSTGLFIHNLDSEDAVREIFGDDDKANILRIEKHGKTNHVVHFKDHETARAALDRQPPDHKVRGTGPPTPGQPRKPNVKWFDDRGTRNSYNRDGQTGGQAGTWQASNRGGAGAGPRQGYQSGQSDSEGGRGRGGFRGRGGRGGERGVGRGGRGGGRGGFNKTASGGEEASTPNKPAQAES